jgi:hypothetical protein
VTPTTPWNVALIIPDINNPGAALNFTQRSAPGPVPYSESAIPVAITGMGRVVNGWGLLHNAAAAPPASPVNCGAAGACGSPVPVTLVPFGSTLLRMTELPFTSA